MRKLRCAIYTRKSTDEGLDQTFNSLDAQREACAAFILSQAGEGWNAVKAIYDDGGFSGGSMERPALQRLLADVQEKRVDVIVVYKVDRLTRSLADFARIVEVLDRAGASFVSVTQAFNTTTSMGRLTLNVLLSFAQFEREVTGERIRDKIAASKAKGMWMGGNPPLGYEVRDRALHVVPAEADIVRDIFQRYLAARNIFEVRDALDRDGVRSKLWVSRAGRARGGAPFSHGGLYYLLSNRIYRGEIVHRQKSYPGQHAAIVDAAVFDRVQSKLAARRARYVGPVAEGRKSPLLGKLFDDSGAAMTSAHANKNGARYFYYVSKAHTSRRPAGSLPRVSAIRLERLLLGVLTPILRKGADPAGAFAAIRRVELGGDQLTIDVLENAIASPEGLAAPPEPTEGGWRITAPHDLKHPSSRRRLLSSGGDVEPHVDRTMLRALVLSRRWTRMLAEGEAETLESLAEREGMCRHYAGQLLPLAYLAPDLVAAIIHGRQPRRLSLASVLAQPLPLVFVKQRQLFAQFE